MIYVVHPIKDYNIDISPALEWGEVRYVRKGYLFAHQLDGDYLPPDLLSDFERCADRFNPKSDFLLIAGDHAQLMIFSALLAMRHPYFRMLRYDRHENAYFPIRVPGARTSALVAA